MRNENADGVYGEGLYLPLTEAEGLALMALDKDSPIWTVITRCQVGLDPDRVGKRVILNEKLNEVWSDET